MKIVKILSHDIRGKKGNLHAQLRHIVGPGQKQNARIVLFPMRHNKRAQDEPQEAVLLHHRDAIRFRAIEKRKNGHRQKKSRPRVQPMIE
jgi:hypothetical protein